MKPVLHSLRLTLDNIKFAHSIFALPFALGAVLVAAHGWPPLTTLGWFLVAMVGARSVAMSLNRVIDLPFDRDNPRTQIRPLVSGALSTRAVWMFTIVMFAAFELACAQLGRLPLLLSPIALAIICGYSFSKRFTWACHLWLGASLALAPLAAQVVMQQQITLPFLALALGVCTWVAGFDIVYATHDAEFDTAHALHSIPARFGIARALWISRSLHVIAAGAFFTFGALAELHTIYFIGAGLMTLGLIIEQSLVRANNLSRVNAAFFTANGYVSAIFLLFTWLAIRG